MLSGANWTAVLIGGDGFGGVALLEVAFAESHRAIKASRTRARQEQ